MGEKSLHTVGRSICPIEEAKSMGPDDSIVTLKKRENIEISLDQITTSRASVAQLVRARETTQTYWIDYCFHQT